MRELGQIVEHPVVLDAVAVKRDESLLHVVGYQQGQLVAFGTFGHLGGAVYHQLDLLAIVAIADEASGIGHALGALLKLVGTGNLDRKVDVELIAAHYHDVVPEFLAIVGLFLELGEQASHGVDDGIGAAGALVAVFDRQAVVDHLLYVASVFGQGQRRAPGVVCEHIWVLINGDTGLRP